MEQMEFVNVNKQLMEDLFKAINDKKDAEAREAEARSKLYGAMSEYGLRVVADNNMVVTKVEPAIGNKLNTTKLKEQYADIYNQLLESVDKKVI